MLKIGSVMIKSHLPVVMGVRQRCKLPSSTGQTVFKCIKCQFHLCLNKNSNCFFNFINKQLNYINNQPLSANPLNVLVPKIYFISIENFFLSWNCIIIIILVCLLLKLNKIVWGIIVAYCYH